MHITFEIPIDWNELVLGENSTGESVLFDNTIPNGVPYCKGKGKGKCSWTTDIMYVNGNINLASIILGNGQKRYINGALIISGNTEMKNGSLLYVN